MTDRNLVPLDQPYGARQQLEAQAAEVGVATSSSQIDVGAQAGAVPSTGPSILRPGGNFDVLEGRAPSMSFQPIEQAAPTVDPSMQLRERLLSSPSPMLREIGRRLG